MGYFSALQGGGESDFGVGELFGTGGGGINWNFLC
jgi:hypothetical protein